jgi:hypothetical protein
VLRLIQLHLSVMIPVRNFIIHDAAEFLEYQEPKVGLSFRDQNFVICFDPSLFLFQARSCISSNKWCRFESEGDEPHAEHRPMCLNSTMDTRKASTPAGSALQAADHHGIPEDLVLSRWINNLSTSKVATSKKGMSLCNSREAVGDV